MVALILFSSISGISPSWFPDISRDTPSKESIKVYHYFSLIFLWFYGILAQNARKNRSSLGRLKRFLSWCTFRYRRFYAYCSTSKLCLEPVSHHSAIKQPFKAVFLYAPCPLRVRVPHKKKTDTFLHRFHRGAPLGTRTPDQPVMSR